MTAMTTRTPATEAELRWSYRLSRLQAQGISYEQAIEAPALRAALELGATLRRRRKARIATTNTGAGIERSQPGFSASAQQS